MKKIKIPIKSIFGKILFEYECDDNTIKKVLLEALKQGADLRGADLRGIDLRGIDLQGIDLRGTYLRGADLRGTDLRGADLQGNDLQGIDLQGIDLRGTYLRGADLRGTDLHGVKIKKAIVITGLYNYIIIPFISESGEKYIRMGCYTRTVKEWENDFWNNPNEFPNDNSLKSNLRLLGFETGKKWFELVESSEK